MRVDLAKRTIFCLGKTPGAHPRAAHGSIGRMETQARSALACRHTSRYQALKRLATQCQAKHEKQPKQSKDDPHPMRRLRHRPWPISGQEMRPLQHTLLWALNARNNTGRRAATTSSARLIKKAGGAEQYNANTKYAEAVAVAVGEMRGGHEGPDVLHLHAGPPLEDQGGPRARCACRGTAGFAHVSCLAEQAKILRRGG